MRLSTHDASFIYSETASGPMHGAALTLLEGHVSYQEILDYYRARIHLIPRFRQKLAFVPFNIAHPKWIDDPGFRLEEHLKPHPVPPGTTLEQAINIGLELGEPLLDRTRPLWLTYVIEHVEGNTLIVQMTHHAFVDGATFVALSTTLTDASPDGEPPAPEDPPWAPVAEPSPMTLWQEAAQEQARAVMTATQAAPLTAEEIRSATSLMQRMARPVIQAPWNAGLVGPERKLGYLVRPLSSFKPIRQALGGTVNDIALTVVAEAATRYMQQKGIDAEGESIRIMCPVNVRSAGDDPLDAASGNRVSGMFPVLDAAPKTILKRFEEVKAEMAGIKARREPELMEALQRAAPPASPMAMGVTLAVGTPFDPTRWAARMPAPVTPAFGVRQQQTGFNFTLTNVPGPAWTQYVAGHRVLNTLGTLMLGGNLGLGVGVGSFDGKMVFNFTVDPRLFPDVTRLRDLVATTFDELADLAAASAGAGDADK